MKSLKPWIITKPSAKRLKIYPLFHFIPGGEEAKDKCCFTCGDSSCFATVANSDNAQKLLKNALATMDLCQIGIAVHAFADTWAHQNFLGLNDKLNAQRGLAAKIIPNIGHADFFHEPDTIHNRWADRRLKKELAQIDNDDRFLAAAEEIFVHLYRFKHPDQNEQQAHTRYGRLKLEDRLRDAMDESYLLGGSEKARITAYKGICGELNLKKYQYDPNAWRYSAVIKKPLESDLFDRYWANQTFLDSDWYKFQEAAKAYREFALDFLHPVFEQLGMAI